VELVYQPRIIIDGKQKTPDFSLTIVDEASRQDAMFSSAEAMSARPGLTLDAKFHQFAPVAGGESGASLADKLGELLGKGYDEDGRSRVFVLHPGYDDDSVRDWRRFCRYGGGHFSVDPDRRPEWDQAAPDHRCGVVLLRPGDMDPLIRLITMHLYLGLPHQDDRLVPFCPSCRGDALTAPEHSQGRSAGQRCQAEDCGQLIVCNHCWNCDTTLYKLGAYWTFHQSRALDPYDIKCPHCGEFMIRPDDEE
jgi:hypothetical protein